MAASTHALIDAFATGLPSFLLPPTSPAYDQVPLGHRTAMIRMRDDIPKEDMQPRRRFVLTAPLPGYDVAESSTTAAAARAPRGQYDFVDTVMSGQSLFCRPGHNARTIARAVDRAEDVGYVRALHDSEHRMMTSIKEARNRALFARLEILEIYMSRIEWQSTEDLAVIQMMRIYALEARARTDTVEDDGSSCGGPRRPVQHARDCSYTDFIKCQPLNFKGTEGIFGLSQWLKKMESVFHISGCAFDNQVKFATCTLLGAALTWWNGHNLRVRRNDVAAYTQRFHELALICTNFLADETEKVDKYISEIPDNIYGNLMSARPKTLDDAIELASDLMDQKLRTYAEMQNDNTRKADDSSRNNQQPHKKQNVARAYTVVPGEKKAYIGNLPLCTKCNYHHIRQCVPKCGNCKRYGHPTNDCRVNTNNNNNKNQKAGSCYECGDTGHIKKNCPKLKNRGNSNGNGVAQGRAYALGGRDATRTLTSSWSAVTYTSISSDLDRPSWGILLMNAGDLPKMDPYGEVTQQGYVPPLLPSYVPNLIELDEYVPVYILELEHPEYHALSDDDIQVED
nr:hypothetical protein [Tanacetum cinerariifolium]